LAVRTAVVPRLHLEAAGPTAAGSRASTATTTDHSVCATACVATGLEPGASVGLQRLDIGARSKVYGEVMSATTGTARGLRVAELAAAVGLAPDTVRYYERAGLLAPPARTPSGYRAYDPDAVDRLRFIQGCQRLGLRLREIRDLLAVRDTGTCPCEPAEQLLRRRVAEVDAEMARLAELRAQMVAMVEALPSAQCLPPSPGTWCPPEEGGD
jgi:DNA-binding transcriptional MerR regulator